MKKAFRFCSIIMAVVFSMAMLSLAGCPNSPDEGRDKPYTPSTPSTPNTPNTPGTPSTPSTPSKPISIAVTGVTLNKGSTYTVVNGTEPLYAVVSPDDATNQDVTWSSNAPSVATVSASGLITGVGVGTATVTVTTDDGGKEAYCTIIVSASNTAVTGISLNNSSATINSINGIGEKETLKTVISPNDATNQNVTWSSSNTDIATVSPGGLVTAVNGGTAIITVTTADGNKTASCTVTVDLVFDSIVAFKAWLDKQPTNTAATVYNVKININNLVGGYDNSGSLGNALYINNTKYVGLDLSGSTFTSIGYDAFSYCEGLTSVIIGNNVTSIREYAFSGCSGLTMIYVDTANTTYSSQDGVLYNKTKLFLLKYPARKTNTSFIIPNSVTGIGDFAFSGCSGLTSVTIPNSVTTIGNYVFSSCTGLTSITIPDNVTNIGDGAFRGCTGLTVINYNATALSDLIDDQNVFDEAGYNTAGITVNIGSNVTKIPAYLFFCIGYFRINSYGKSMKINAINFADGSVCKSIGVYAFSHCTGLNSVTIPDSVTSIRSWAFSGCTSLTSVIFATGSNIPDENFSEEAFLGGYGEDSLKSVYAEGKAGMYTRTGSGTLNAPYTWTKQ